MTHLILASLVLAISILPLYARAAANAGLAFPSPYGRGRE